MIVNWSWSLFSWSWTDYDHFFHDCELIMITVENCRDLFNFFFPPSQSWSYIYRPAPTGVVGWIPRVESTEIPNTRMLEASYWARPKIFQPLSNRLHYWWRHALESGKIQTPLSYKKENTSSFPSLWRSHSEAHIKSLLIFWKLINTS